MESTPNELLPKIQVILQGAPWSLKDEDKLEEMAQKVIDKSPQNPKELHGAL